MATSPIQAPIPAPFLSPVPTPIDAYDPLAATGATLGNNDPLHRPRAQSASRPAPWAIAVAVAGVGALLIALVAVMATLPARSPAPRNVADPTSNSTPSQTLVRASIPMPTRRANASSRAPASWSGKPDAGEFLSGFMPRPIAMPHRVSPAAPKAFAANGRAMVSSKGHGQDRVFVVLDPQDGRQVAEIAIPDKDAMLQPTLMTPDGARLAFTHLSGDSATVVSLPDGQVAAKLTASNREVIPLAFPRADLLATHDKGNTITGWNLGTQAPAWKIQLEPGWRDSVSPEERMAVSPRGQRLYVWNRGRLEVYDLNDGAKLGESESFDEAKAIAIGIRPDGLEATVLIADKALTRGDFLVFDLADGRMVDRIPDSRPVKLLLDRANPTGPHQWSVVALSMGEIDYWGGDHLLVDTGHVLDLRQRRFVALLDDAGHRARQFGAVLSVGSQAPAIIRAVFPHEAHLHTHVDRVLATGSRFPIGATVALQLDLTAPPSPDFPRAFMEGIRDHLQRMGLTLADTGESRLSIKASVVRKATKGTMFSRNQNPTEVAESQISWESTWVDANGATLWKSRGEKPAQFVSLQVNETIAANLREAAWTSLYDAVVRELPTHFGASGECLPLQLRFEQEKLIVKE